jgi:cytochrome c oxidase subunit II
MTTFLTYLIIILTVVAIAQLIRVFELTGKLKGRKEEEISLSDNRTNANLMLLFLVAFMASYVWLIKAYGSEMLPKSASLHGESIDWLMDFNMIIINIVFVLMNILLFYFSYKYYYRPERKAVFFAHSNKLEMIWTLVPSAVLAVIIIYGLKTWNEITGPASEDAIVVELYSKQFDWTARYAGNDNLLGEANVRKISGANFVGLDSNDVKGHDDIIVKGEFHIPVGKEISFKFRSQDVLHGAYMPHFRSQMNTVPGMVTSWHMIPTVTTEEMRRETNNPNFDYILLCNKICGASHYNMQMTIIVESEEDYNKWLSEQQTFLTKEQSAEIIAKNENSKLIANK